MGMFDAYEPDPPLACPVCGRTLAGWQGKDGPNALFVWRQGRPEPVDQRASEDCRLAPEARARFRLPERFEIETVCCGGRFPVTATCRAPQGSWSETTLVTAATARQGKNERAEEFRARLRWLRGEGR